MNSTLTLVRLPRVEFVLRTPFLIRLPFTHLVVESVKALEDKIEQSLQIFRTRRRHKNVGVAGGMYTKRCYS